MVGILRSILLMLSRAQYSVYVLPILCSCALAETNDPIRAVYMPKSHTSSGNPFLTFYWDLAQIALAPKRSGCTNLQLIERQDWVSYERLRLQLRVNKKLDVLWGVSSYEREEQYHAIKIDLLKRLNSYRALVVRKNRVAEFEGQPLKALQAFSAGSAYHWVDSKVLAANGFDVVTFSDFDTMYPMLSRGRFDFASRGLDQLWDELSHYDKPDFTPVPKLYLHYPLPVYFFVRKDDVQLAACLQTGLEAAFTDGSYQTLFNAVQSFREGEALLKQKGNTIIELINPYLIAPN